MFESGRNVPLVGFSFLFGKNGGVHVFRSYDFFFRAHEFPVHHSSSSSADIRRLRKCFGLCKCVNFVEDQLSIKFKLFFFFVQEISQAESFQETEDG